MTTRKKAVAKRGASTSIANIQDMLKQEVENIENQIEQHGGNRIYYHNGQFEFPDKTTDPGPIEVVIVDFNSVNRYPRYNPKTKEPPVCWALGKNVKEMRPSPNAPKPQAADCASCPMNQFGSDGDGKACANTRQLVVAAPDDTAEAPLMTVSVSSTSLKFFDSHVNTVAKLHKLPPIGVVTELSTAPKGNYYQLHFSTVGPNENVATHLERRPEAEAILAIEPKPAEAPAAAPRTARKRAGNRR